METKMSEDNSREGKAKRTHKQTKVKGENKEKRQTSGLLYIKFYEGGVGKEMNDEGAGYKKVITTVEKVNGKKYDRSR